MAVLTTWATTTRLAVAGVAVAGVLALTACGGAKSSGDAGSAQSSVESVTWSAHTGFQLPTSDAAGPEKWTNGVPEGFSHDVGGAVMAAANLSIALDTADQKTFGDVLAKTTLDDAGRVAWAQARAGITIPSGITPTKVPALIGWAGDGDGTSEEVTVYLYWRQYDNSLTEQRRRMVWSDGWKLALPDNPQTPEIRAVDTLPDGAQEFSPPSP